MFNFKNKIEPTLLTSSELVFKSSNLKKLLQINTKRMPLASMDPFCILSNSTKLKSEAIFAKLQRAVSIIVGQFLKYFGHRFSGLLNNEAKW